MAKKGLLVASFGTSHQDALESCIIPLEECISKAFPDYEMRRAFGSNIIIKILKERDGLQVDTIKGAFENFKKDGFSELLVQPTYIIHGFEYDMLMDVVRSYENEFDSIKVGRPLLNEEEDYDKLIEGLATLEETKEDALVFMGHGTEHFANACYPALEHRMHSLGYSNFFVGTVEGYPEISHVCDSLKKAGYKKATLMPLMVVAGDHAKNDMAGDEEDSWKNQIGEIGVEANCILRGLGGYEFIQKMFRDHALSANEE